MNQETMVAIENLLTSMDMISKLDLLHGFLRHGRLHRFEWVDTTGYEVESILRQYDIHAYGRAIWVHLVPDGEGKKRREMHRWMWVNRGQAPLAEYVLLRAGLTLTTPLIDPENVRRAAKYNGVLPTPWKRGKKSKPVTPIEAIFDWFAGLVR